MTRRFALGLGILLVAGAAQDSAAQRRGWVPPDCDLSTGHYLVNSALLYLKNAAETRFADQRDRDLSDAKRVLTQALDQGRDDDPAVWYFLGRYYATKQDLAGADTAFARAARLQPECQEDINLHRRLLWVPLLNNGVEALRAGDNDAALTQFRQANQIYDLEPPGFYYIGQIYANRRNVDSAVSYFAKALDIAEGETSREDEQYDDIRNNAAFNVARLYHRSEDYDSAVVWYERYRAVNPEDPEGMTGQASALAAAGREEAAVALYDSALALADEFSTIELFVTGVALFQANRPDMAAEAFELGLERNPHYRDALFNLANTYLSLAERDSGLSETARDDLGQQYGEKMDPVTAKLVEIDPASAAALRLRAAAYQLRGLRDSTLAVLERLEELPFDLTVSVFQPIGNGTWELRGVITNQREEAITVPPLTFEFVTEEGEVVETVQLESQELEGGGGIAPFVAQPQGEEIAAWRYQLES